MPITAMSVRTVTYRLQTCVRASLLNKLSFHNIRTHKYHELSTLWCVRSSHLELLTAKRFCSAMSSRDLFYDDIVKLSTRNEIFLIDVREPSEIQESGKLPKSINIPLGEVSSALSLDASSFQQKYGTQKPDVNSSLVFSCRSGKRSQMALKTALDLGYCKSCHYAGGFLDWEAHAKQDS